MLIFMFGYFVGKNEIVGVVEDCWWLKEFVDMYDVVFLFIDICESWWLFIFLCVDVNKVCKYMMIEMK